jgi:hypothetical protein
MTAVACSIHSEKNTAASIFNGIKVLIMYIFTGNGTMACIARATQGEGE